MPIQRVDCIFVHRQNEDGTFDSICIGCFQTVALGMNEPDLEQLEGEHVCVAEDRARFDEWRSRSRRTDLSNIESFRLKRSA